MFVLGGYHSDFARHLIAIGTHACWAPASAL